MNKHIQALRDDMSQGKYSEEEWTAAIKETAGFLKSYSSLDYEVEVVMKPKPDDVKFDENKVRSLFELAGFKVLNLWRLENRYWPDSYVELRIKNPWWLVKTDIGLIQIGPRKKVFVIDWSETSVRKILTEDTTTKEETMIHAWTYAKMVEYLQALRNASEELKANSNE